MRINSGKFAYYQKLHFDLWNVDVISYNHSHSYEMLMKQIVENPELKERLQRELIKEEK